MHFPTIEDLQELKIKLTSDLTGSVSWPFFWDPRWGGEAEAQPVKEKKVYKLQVITYKLQVITNKLQVITYKLQVITYKLQVITYK